MDKTKRDLEKYQYRSPNSNYSKLFREEKRKLIKKLGNEAVIEHIGSTAVSGLGGKGIIDIIIAVPKGKRLKAIRPLKTLGFDYKPQSGDKDRRFFQKIIKHHGKERIVHLHLTYIGSEQWKAKIAMREYLKENRNSRKEYAKIKKDAAKFAKGEGKKYRAFKRKFLDNLEKKALKWYVKHETHRPKQGSNLRPIG